MGFKYKEKCYFFLKMHLIKLKQIDIVFHGNYLLKTYSKIN